jgi:hypothetical protein
MSGERAALPRRRCRIASVFSGGSYDEVARWLRNFLTSHAKREHPRVEVVLDADEALEARAYRARLRLAGRLSEPMELDYKDVAEHRGELAWCAALAARTRALARSLLPAGSAGDARAR